MKIRTLIFVAPLAFCSCKGFGDAIIGTNEAVASKPAGGGPSVAEAAASTAIAAGAPASEVNKYLTIGMGLLGMAAAVAGGIKKSQTPPPPVA